MFTKARLKLTGWYLLIIMVISALFSLGVYRQSTLELDRGLRSQALRLNRSFGGQLSPRMLDTVVIEESRRNIASQLIFINIGIFIFSGFAAYFLAGKTLKPIEFALDEQKRFICDASHELRTPLTAIKTEIEVGLRDKKFDIKQARSLLKSNLEEIDKMQALSNYLLTLNRYDSVNYKINFTRVKLSEIISKALAGTKESANKKGVKISHKGEDAVIMGNSISLTEVVIIFIDNAIKYSHNKNSVTIKTGFDRKNAYISVSDFGIGIKASDIPYIFNRFYRADSSRSKVNIEGYGLGLSIAKSIIDLHHGKIHVESIPNEGSTFTVSLPLKQSTKLV